MLNFQGLGTIIFVITTYYIKLTIQRMTFRKILIWGIKYIRTVPVMMPAKFGGLKINLFEGTL